MAMVLRYVGPGIFLILAIIMAAVASTFPPPGQANDPGTAAFPNILAVFFGGLAILLALQPKEGREASARPKGTRGKLARVASILALIVAYVFLLDLAGFIVSTTLFLIAASYLSERKRAVVVVIFALLTSLLLFVLFYVLLQVSLPAGPLERLLS